MISPFHSLTVHMSESDTEDEINYADGTVLHISRNTHQVHSSSCEATATTDTIVTNIANTNAKASVTRSACQHSHNVPNICCVTSPTEYTPCAHAATAIASPAAPFAARATFISAPAPELPRRRASVSHIGSVVSSTTRLCAPHTGQTSIVPDTMNERANVLTAMNDGKDNHTGTNGYDASNDNTLKYIIDEGNEVMLNTINESSCEVGATNVMHVGKPPARLSRRALTASHAARHLIREENHTTAVQTQVSTTMGTDANITFASVASASTSSLKFTTVNGAPSAASIAVPQQNCSPPPPPPPPQQQQQLPCQPAEETRTACSQQQLHDKPNRSIMEVVRVRRVSSIIDEPAWRQQRFDGCGLCQKINRALCAQGCSPAAVRARRDVLRVLQPIRLTRPPSATSLLAPRTYHTPCRAGFCESETGKRTCDAGQAAVSQSESVPFCERDACCDVRCDAAVDNTPNTEQDDKKEEEEEECSCVCFPSDELEEGNTSLSALLQDRSKFRQALHALYHLSPVPFYRSSDGPHRASHGCPGRNEHAAPPPALSLVCTLTVSSAARSLPDGAPWVMCDAAPSFASLTGQAATRTAVSVPALGCSTIGNPAQLAPEARHVDRPAVWNISSPGERRVLRVCGQTTRRPDPRNGGAMDDAKSHRGTSDTTNAETNHNHEDANGKHRCGEDVHDRRDTDGRCESCYDAVFFLPPRAAVAVSGNIIEPAPVAVLPLTPRVMNDPVLLSTYRRYLVHTQPRTAIMANNAEDYATFTGGGEEEEEDETAAGVCRDGAHRGVSDGSNRANPIDDSARSPACAYCGYLTLTVVRVSTQAKHTIDLTLVLVPYRLSLHPNASSSSSSSSLSSAASAASVASPLYRVPFHPDRTLAHRALHRLALTFDSHADFLSAYRTLIACAGSAIAHMHAPPDTEESGGCGELFVVATHSPWGCLRSALRTPTASDFYTRCAHYARKAVQSAPQATALPDQHGNTERYPNNNNNNTGSNKSKDDEDNESNDVIDSGNHTDDNMDDDDNKNADTTTTTTNNNNNINNKEICMGINDSNRYTMYNSRSIEDVLGCVLPALAHDNTAVVGYTSLGHVAQMVCAWGANAVYDVRVLPRQVWSVGALTPTAAAAAAADVEEREAEVRCATPPLLWCHWRELHRPESAHAARQHSEMHDDDDDSGCASIRVSTLTHDEAMVLQHCSQLPFQTRLYGMWSDEWAYYALYEPWVSAQHAGHSSATSILTLAEFVSLILYPTTTTTTTTARTGGGSEWFAETDTQEARLQLAHLLLTQLIVLVASLHGKGMLLGPCPPHRLCVHLSHAAAASTCAVELTSAAVQLRLPSLGLSSAAWSYEREQPAVVGYLCPRYLLDAMQHPLPGQAVWSTRDDWWTVLCIFYDLFCPTGESLVPTWAMPPDDDSFAALDAGAAPAPTHPSTRCICVWEEIIHLSRAESTAAPVGARVCRFVHDRVLAGVSAVLDNWILTKADEMTCGMGRGGLSFSTEDAVAAAGVGGAGVSLRTDTSSATAARDGGAGQSLAEMGWVMHYRAVVDGLLEAVFPPASSRPCAIHQPARTLLSLPFFATVDVAQVCDGREPLSPVVSQFVRNRLTQRCVASHRRRRPPSPCCGIDEETTAAANGEHDGRLYRPETRASAAAANAACPVGGEGDGGGADGSPTAAATMAWWKAVMHSTNATDAASLSLWYSGEEQAELEEVVRAVVSARGRRTGGCAPSDDDVGGHAEAEVGSVKDDPTTPDESAPAGADGAVSALRLPMRTTHRTGCDAVGGDGMRRDKGAVCVTGSCNAALDPCGRDGVEERATSGHGMGRGGVVVRRSACAPAQTGGEDVCQTDGMPATAVEKSDSDGMPGRNRLGNATATATAAAAAGGGRRSVVSKLHDPLQPRRPRQPRAVCHATASVANLPELHPPSV